MKLIAWAKAQLATLKARHADWRRECRIRFHYDEARFAELRGFTETRRFHALAMCDEMNLRSPEQRARLAKQARRQLVQLK